MLDAKPKKPWYLSKTLWANALALVGMAVQTKTGFVVDAEVQAAVLAFINVLLRFWPKAPLGG